MFRRFSNNDFESEYFKDLLLKYSTKLLLWQLTVMVLCSETVPVKWDGKTIKQMSFVTILHRKLCVRKLRKFIWFFLTSWVGVFNTISGGEGGGIRQNMGREMVSRVWEVSVNKVCLNMRSPNIHLRNCLMDTNNQINLISQWRFILISNFVNHYILLNKVLYVQN